MRKSKYDPSSLFEDDKGKDENDNISSLKKRVELDTEIVNL